MKGKRAAALEASLAAAVELVNEWRRLARRLANSLAKDGGSQDCEEQAQRLNWWSERCEGMRLLRAYEWWMRDGHLEKSIASSRQSGKTLMMSTPTRGQPTSTS